MSRSAAVLSLFLGACAVLTGCNGPHPFVNEGDANSVEVRYSGNPESALPLARQHCAQYERVPKLSYLTTDGAHYDCITPPRAP